jgi:Domain of unknown function (DUF397)
MDLTNAAWRKSSYSGNNGGNCVEVARLPAAIAVRDSKRSDGPVLLLNPQAWHAFIASLKAGTQC